MTDHTLPATPPRPVRPRRVDVSSLRDYGIVVSFAVLFVVLSLSSDVFLTSTNLLNVLDQWAPAGIIAVAVTLVLIAGGFDLAVGSTFALAGVVAALMMKHTGPLPAMALGVIAATACGLINGVITTVGRVNTFIGTLATSIMIGGVATLLTDGQLVTVSDPAFTRLGSDSLLGVKYSIWVFALVSLTCGFLLSRTIYGRAIYAAGGNPEAARLSGVRVSLVRASTFVVSGAAAGVAGIIVASRVSTGQADAGGLDLTFDAITAMVIGGNSILGGAGAIWRTILGLFLLALISNGFNLLGVDSMYQNIFTGAIILLAVGIDAWARGSER
jgi:ribose transport system permease protein